MYCFVRCSNNSPREAGRLPATATGSAVPLRIQLIESRIARYFLVGCLAATIQFAVMNVGVEAFAIQKPIATTVGFLVAVTFNYGVQRRFTFSSDAPHKHVAPSFLAAACVLAVVNVVLFSLLIGHINYIIAQVFTTLAVFLLNYEFNRRFTFRSR